jgi:predicted transporter
VAAPGFAWPSGVIPLINSSDEDVAGDSTAYGLFNFQSGNLYVSYLTSGELTPINTPEPATLTMLASGLVAFGGFGVSRRRRRASKQNEVC